MPESDTTDIEWVDCPGCTPGSPRRDHALTARSAIPSGYLWCDLCCHCDEAGALGMMNLGPDRRSKEWHAARGNRVGYVEAGADVRYALRSSSFEEYQRLCAENLASVFRLPRLLRGNANSSVPGLQTPPPVVRCSETDE